MRNIRLVTLALVLAASPALADNKAKAKALYEEGLKHYNVAEWQDAIKSWKEAYLLSKKPLLLFNIGQAYRLSGDCKQAQVFYDSYQREEPNPKNQAELDDAIALCAKQADKPVDKPADKVIDKPADTPVPAVTAPTTTVAQAEPAVTETPEQTDEPATSGGGMRKIGIGVGAAGVVALGVGVYFGLQARSTANKLDGFSGEWTQEQEDLQAKGKHDQTLGIALDAVGVAALAAGGVMFAIGGPKAVEQVSIVPTHGGAAIGWSGRF